MDMQVYVILTTVILCTSSNKAIARSMVDTCCISLYATRNSKNFSTPGYSIVPYPNAASYKWRIQAPKHRLVLITFLEGNTESCCDHIGVNDDTGTIGKFSGIITPGTSRISSGRILTLSFSSDDSITFNGFRARYQTATCGRNIPITTTTPTELTSVGWPNKYFHDQNCFWILYGVERKQIELKLIEGRIAENDYIEVFDGLSSMGRQSGVIQESVFTSKNGILTLTFTSDGENRDRGFFAEYKQASCGTTSRVTNMPVEISTPSYPNFYPNDLQCEWNLIAARTQRIKIIFIEGDTEDCCDIIEFIDRDTNLGTFSGSIIPGSSITSNSNKLQIRFVSDSSGIAPGFHALFQEVDASSTCGGVLTVSDTPMNISSPLYPFTYENNLSCSWTLQAESHRTIMLTFLEGSTQDCCDVIRVTDQMEVIRNLSGLIKEQVTLMSKSNSLTITFNSDSSNVSSGFFATFHQVAVATTMSTTPESTTTPTTTSTTLESTTTATTIPITTKSTTIPATMPTSSESAIAGQCPVRNTSAAEATRRNCRKSCTKNKRCKNGRVCMCAHECGYSCINLDNFCPDPPSIPNQLKFKVFRKQNNSSNEVTPPYKFDDELVYVCKPGYSKTLPLIRHYCHGRGNWTNIGLSTCENQLDATSYSKNFSTPRYSIVLYPNDVSYKWQIQAPRNLLVFITFLEGNTESCCDFIRVNDDTGTIGQFSGTIIPGTSRISSGRELTISFSSDDSITFNGFRARYQTATCGRNIPITTTTPTELTSVGWPNKYFHDQNCFWILYGVERKQIELKLIEGRIAENDYIEIFDGLSSMGRLSGVIQESVFTSKNGILTLTFTSDGENRDRGFFAEYEQASCGTTSRITNMPVEISTPSYPNFYPNDLQCEWNLIAAPTQRIKVIFIEGDTEDCCDIVEFIDGNTNLGTFSGNIIPGSSITSNSNELQIRFVSDSSGIAPGFRALFQGVDASSTCGGVLTVSDTPMNISSPLYPFIYENNLSCSWTLQAESHRIIMLTFLEGSTQECCDIIRVTDQMEVILTLSGLIKEQVTLMSKSNSLTITFNSDSSNVSSGFFATFHQVAVATTMSTTPESTTTPTTIPITTESTTIPATMPTSPESAIAGQCPVRNTSAAEATGRKCRKSCTKNKRCKNGRVCMCAHECGYSCIKLDNFCPDPPSIPNQLKFEVFRKQKNSSNEVTPPYKFDDELVYVCKPGYSKTLRLILHYCHGRRNWTNIGLSTCEITTFAATTEASLAAITTRIPTTLEATTIRTTSFATSEATTIPTMTSTIMLTTRKSIETATTSTTSQATHSTTSTTSSTTSEATSNRVTTSTTKSNKATASTTAATTMKTTPASTTTAQICGGNYTASETPTSVTSPNWPNKYPKDLECEWIISIPPSMKVKLTIIELHTEPGFDFLEIHDGHKVNETLDGRLTSPRAFNSTSGYLRLKFVSDLNQQKTGFRASFLCCSI